VDNNLFLSDLNLWNMAVGSAYINNLFAGQICEGGESERFTPYHYPHSTKVAGIMTLLSGDDRYYNNIFLKTPVPSYDIFENARRPKRREGTMDFGLGMYDRYPADKPESDFPLWEMSRAKLPVVAEHNLYQNGAVPYKNGVNELLDRETDAEIRLEERAEGIYLVFTVTENIATMEGVILNSFDLGEAMVPGVIFEHPDGTPILLNRDYFHKRREKGLNAIGPIRDLGSGQQSVKVWDK
jgi:hypothetical protein